MNKYLMTAAALVLTSAAYSDHHKNYTGFALGGTVGYGMGNASAVTSGTANNLATGVTQKNNLSLKGFNGGLFVTYGWMLQKSFYVGLEAFGKLSNMEGTQEFLPGNANANAPKFNSSIKAKNTNSFGAALRLGGVVNSMLAYVKVGVESANWKFEQANDQRLLNNANFGLVGGSKSRRLTGIPFGFGVETIFCDRWVAGLEATHTRYSSTTTVTTSQTNGAITGTVSNKFKPNKSEVNVRLAYKF